MTAENPTPIVGGAVSATGDQGSTSSPAENTATVREIGDELLKLIGPPHRGGHLSYTERVHNRKIKLARALFAQAEAAERKVKQLARRHDLYMDGAADSLNKMHARAEAAEAERDDAVRERDRLGNELAQERAKPGGSFDQWDRLQVAERAAEQAQAALRDIAEGRWNTASRSLDIPAPPYRDARQYARAALTGEGTE